MQELRGIRARVQAAETFLPDVIEEVEPEVRTLLGAEEQPEPLHVLLVGTMSANAFVARLDDDLAVLHCLEWFAGRDPARVLVAHEDTHAWHRRLLDGPPEDDLAWMAFYEGLAVRVSREVVPGRPEEEYFWYGVEGFEDWLPWCREHRELLWTHFRDALEDPSGGGSQDVERFFGGAFIEGHWRTGFFLADEMVASLEAEPAELYRMDPDQARSAIRAAAGL